MHHDEPFHRILALTMKGLLYHCAACMMYDTVSPQKLPITLFLPVLFLPLLSFALIRDKCSKLSVFILMHIAISGISLLFISDLPARIIAGCCLFSMVLSSFRLRLKPVYEQQESSPPVVSVSLFLLIYFIAQFNHRTQIMQISYYEIFLYLILFAVYKSLSGTSRFIKSNQEINNLPSRHIKILNRMILFVFILFLILGMIGMQSVPIESVFSGAGSILLIILRGIIRLIFRLFGNEKLPEEESLPDEDLSPLLLQSGESSPFLQILEQLIMTVFYLLLIYVFVKFVLKFLYELYRKFYEQHKAETDDSEFLWKNTVTREKIKKTFNKTGIIYPNTPNQKIRRMYKKYIRRQFDKKSVIPAAMTPVELEHYILSKQDERKPDQDTFHNPDKAPSHPSFNDRRKNLRPDTLHNSSAQQRLALYEKARYSQWECSKQDVETLKHNL